MTTNSTLKLSTCNRCNAYVFVALSSGQKVAADPTPLDDQEAYIAALVAGKAVFDLMEQAGRPHKLLTRTAGSNPPEFGPEPVRGPGKPRRRPILAEHSCGAKGRGMDTRKVDVAAVDPRRGPVKPGSAKGGHLRPGAPAEAPRGRLSLPAGSASRRRSDGPPPTCSVCGRRISENQPFSGVHHVRWQFAYHEECP